MESLNPPRASERFKQRPAWHIVCTLCLPQENVQLYSRTACALLQASVQMAWQVCLCCGARAVMSHTRMQGWQGRISLTWQAPSCVRADAGEQDVCQVLEVDLVLCRETLEALPHIEEVSARAQ